METKPHDQSIFFTDKANAENQLDEYLCPINGLQKYK
jgi:hypothetical protein